MASHAVLINLPDALFEALQRRAELARHTVEEEIAKVLEEAVPVDEEGLSPELESMMEALFLMEDHTLWNVASAKIPETVTNQMEVLYNRRLAKGLTEDEEQELARLEKMFEKNVLVRAQAAMLLKERGLLEKVER